jgi:hypothetical protein
MILPVLRKALLSVAAIIAFSASPAHAQFFGPAGLCTAIDPITGPQPCATVVNQILEYVRQGLQLEREITTAEQELIAGLTLPAALFQGAEAQIQQLTNLTRQADLLANGTGGFIGNLGAPVYPLPENGMQQLIAGSNAVANAIQTLGQVINAENPRLATAAATLSALSAESLANAGRHQTLQDQAQIQAAHAQQLQSLEAIKMADAQAQQATKLADHDRKAMADQWGNLAATAYTPYPMTGQNF